MSDAYTINVWLVYGVGGAHVVECIRSAFLVAMDLSTDFGVAGDSIDDSIDDSIGDSIDGEDY